LIKYLPVPDKEAAYAEVKKHREDRMKAQSKEAEAAAAKRIEPDARAEEVQSLELRLSERSVVAQSVQEELGG
jgi:hypothetical protein